jgi:hypothetical protein
MASKFQYNSEIENFNNIKVTVRNPVLRSAIKSALQTARSQYAIKRNAIYAETGRTVEDAIRTGEYDPRHMKLAREFMAAVQKINKL